MMETWKPVVGFEGMYAVSNTGRVKRVACVVKTERGQRVFAERLKALVERDMNGYPQVLVTLSKNNKAIQLLLSGVVAAAFIGPRPDGMLVLHSDGSSRNNAAYNLRYGTQAENCQDAITHGTTLKGRKNPSNVLSGKQVREIRERLAADSSRGVGTKLAAEYGVNPNTIYAIRKGRSWGWLDGNHV